eukprot:COSAG05_NODE_6919_length_881_cov_1.771100_1_plen_141_part_00
MGRYLCGRDVWEPATCTACFAVLTGDSPATAPAANSPHKASDGASPHPDIYTVAAQGGSKSPGRSAGVDGEARQDSPPAMAEVAGAGGAATAGRVASRVAQTVWQEQLRRQLLLASNRGLSSKAAEAAAEAAARYVSSYE